jgi:hypothetical protein
MLLGRADEFCRRAPTGSIIGSKSATGLRERLGVRGGGADMSPYRDLLTVVKPQADGPVVGSYASQPIAASVVDCFGRRFLYVGAAPRGHNGQYDFNALSLGEWIVEPGLVYALCDGKRDNASAKSRYGSRGRAFRGLREVLSGWLH